MRSRTETRLGKGDQDQADCALVKSLEKTTLSWVGSDCGEEAKVEE